ncbi:porphobilinogen deaminase [Lambiella insularis]|nr:porphobilinogen deaminase [Lambiella insularis]
MATAIETSTLPTTSHDSHPSTQSTPKTTFHIGTRRSALALVQTSVCHSLLTRLYPSCTFPTHPMATMGDKNQTTALHAFNAKALWTHELEAQLISGDLDLVVHSLKDMPTQLPEGCILGAAISRSERRDCVVMSPGNVKMGKKTLGDLEAGEVVGTSSVRRGAQVRRMFPHLVVESVRGSIGTRLAKLDAEGAEYGCLILAAAGLQRTEEGGRISSFLSRREGGWLGAVGQGALGVEVRQSDKEVGELMQGLMSKAEGEAIGQRCYWECLAERSMLRTLEGGCSVPIGVETEWVKGNGVGASTAADTTQQSLLMHAIVVSVDGTRAVEGSRTQAITSAEEAEEFGWKMAQELVEKGAGKILEEILLNRKIIAEQDGA